VSQGAMARVCAAAHVRSTRRTWLPRSRSCLQQRRTPCAQARRAAPLALTCCSCWARRATTTLLGPGWRKNSLTPTWRGSSSTSGR
jgi:hypothetical protein